MIPGRKLETLWERILNVTLSHSENSRDKRIGLKGAGCSLNRATRTGVPAAQIVGFIWVNSLSVLLLGNDLVNYAAYEFSKLFLCNLLPPGTHSRSSGLSCWKSFECEVGSWGTWSSSGEQRHTATAWGRLCVTFLLRDKTLREKQLRKTKSVSVDSSKGAETIIE